MIPNSPTWNSACYLRTNCLSSYWKPAYRPHGCAAISLVPLYVAGMVNFAVSLIPRIIGLVKDILIFAVIFALAIVFPPCISFKLLEERGKKLLSSVAEVFTGIIGTLCPPLAVYLEEKLQCSEEACLRTLPWNFEEARNWVHAKATNPTYIIEHAPPPNVSVDPLRNDSKPPPQPHSDLNQKKVDAVVNGPTDELLIDGKKRAKPKEQSLVDMVQATKAAVRVLSANNKDFDLTMTEDMEIGFSLAIAVLLYDNNSLDLRGYLDQWDLENFNSYQNKVAPFIPGYRTDIMGEKSPSDLKSDFIEMIKDQLTQTQTEETRLPFMVALKEAGKKLAHHPFGAQVLKGVLSKASD
jgi:hypothetical protein